jgi:hypothetical protein
MLEQKKEMQYGSEKKFDGRMNSLLLQSNRQLDYENNITPNDKPN